MDKMIMIVYNEAIDMEVMEVLQDCGLKNYTKIAGVYGRGTTSGAHLGSDIWPGKNNTLLVGCEEKQAKEILGCVEELRKKLGHEGIKGFILPLEDVT